MRNVLTALDVGTSKVCALVAESLPEGGGATVLGYGVAPCTGLRKGVVVNIEATVEAIRAAVTEAEKTTRIVALQSPSGSLVANEQSLKSGSRVSNPTAVRWAPFPSTP